MSAINQNLKEELSTYLSQKINKDKQKAVIIAAYKLSEEEVAAIKKTFPEIGNYQIENRVDSSILGGFIIKYGSYVIDLSIKGRLNNFKKLFYEIS